jgi:hypothetical protein
MTTTIRRIDPEIESAVEMTITKMMNRRNAPDDESGGETTITRTMMITMMTTTAPAPRDANLDLWIRLSEIRTSSFSYFLHVYAAVWPSSSP